MKYDCSFSDLINRLSRCGVNLISVPKRIAQKAADIHISAGAPIKVYCSDRDVFTAEDKTFSQKDVAELFYRLCDYSVYKHMEEIREGYITVFDRYRCGIAGTAYIRQDELVSVSNVTSLNIRIPRHVSGTAEKLFRCKVDLLDGLLIIGEPSSGKTTVLRDIITHLEGKRCVVVDERRELTAGFALRDIDILLGYRKRTAISQAIRCLSPRYIVCDELDYEDIPAIKLGMSAGVSFIASSHGKIQGNYPIRPVIEELISTGAFGNIVILSGRDKPGVVKEVQPLSEFVKAYGCSVDNILWPDNWSEPKQPPKDKIAHDGRL